MAARPFKSSRLMISALKGGIFRFDYLDAWVLLQEVAALHQGDGVRVHLGDVVPLLIGQTHETMRDA